MSTIKQQFFPLEAQFLATAFPAIRNLGTNFPVTGLAFDASTAENAFFKFIASNYGSGNLTLNLVWYADNASANDVIWGAAIAAYTPDTDTGDIETKAFATANTVTDTCLGSGQRVMKCAITISNLDSLAADDLVHLKIYRDAAAGGDTVTGDCVLIAAEVTYSDT